MLQDLRYALRSFARNPGLVSAAVVCLGLGIGANATIFGVVDTLWFTAPPHIANPDHVVRLYFRKSVPPWGTSTASTTGHPVYRTIRDSAHAFDAVAAFTGSSKASLGLGAEARSIDLALVTASYFPLLGVQPALGRFYGVDEDRVGGPPVAVLSYRFWRSSFGGDSSVIGRRAQLGRGSYEVVGVAPERFTGVNLQNVDVWVPLTVAAPEFVHPAALEHGYFLEVIGRLRPDRAAAAGREATLAYRTEPGYSGPDPNAAAVIGPLQQARGPEMSQNAKVSFWLAAVSMIVLLIACANVANLLLARSVTGQREVAVRLALGAGWGRLARQILTESVVLAIAGGAAAMLVTLWSGPLIRTFLLPDIPALGGPMEGRVAVFTAIIAILTGLLAGIAPTWHVHRGDLTLSLRSGPGEGRYQCSRLRSGLLIGQVALTVVLLVGAGLFARSLRNVEGQNLGFDLEHTLVATMDLRAGGYNDADINRLHLEMLARVEALPGIEAAAATVGHPFGYATACSVELPGRDSIPELRGGGPFCQRVTPNYFAAMGTPVRGRAFTASDRGVPVAIISETMARVLWPGDDPVGKCFVTSQRCTEVVGVVADARRFDVVEPAAMHFYLPFTGEGDAITALVLRVRGQPEAWIGSVRSAVQSSVANLPFVAITPIADLVAPSIRPWRLGSSMFGLFALLALALSAVGLYGVLAYTVTQRTHEIGVRVAMGAQSGDVLRQMIAHGVRIAAMGGAVGALAALLGGQALSSLLFGVSSRDPLVLLVAVMVPIVVAAVASYFPARRASRVDPMIALRTE